MKWISVKDRLPAGSQSVIAAGWWGVVGGISYGGGGVWYNDEGIPYRGTTHWMPLPSAPSEKETEE